MTAICQPGYFRNNLSFNPLPVGGKHPASTRASQWCAGLLLLAVQLFSYQTLAFERLAITLDRLSGASWRASGVRFEIDHLSQATQDWSLSLATLELPSPLDRVKVVDLRCSRARLEEKHFQCEDGKARLQSPWLDAPEMAFSFDLAPTASVVRAHRIRLAGAEAAFDARFNADAWRIQVSARGVEAAALSAWLPALPLRGFSGRLDIKATLAGHSKRPEQLSLDIHTSPISGETADGRHAVENLTAALSFQARRDGQADWRSQVELRVLSGAVYVEPVFLAIEQAPLLLKGEFRWLGRGETLLVDALQLSHPGVFEASGKGRWRVRQALKGLSLNLHMASSNLHDFHELYGAPFAEAGAFAGLSLAGSLGAELGLREGELIRLRAGFSDLSLTDPAQRLKVDALTGLIDWNRDGSPGLSSLSWDALQFYRIPVGRSGLNFVTEGYAAHLRGPVSIPVLDGRFRVNRFEVDWQQAGAPAFDFDGLLEAVSLEKLTQALDWLPLTGTLTGRVPGLSFRTGTLAIAGLIEIEAFDGHIEVGNLQVADLFGTLPRMNADVVLKNLDLAVLTEHFSFGNIQGRLEGRVDDLVLENWRPRAFDAWFGTPAGDRSRHRISQTAVENLTNLGGGAAVNVLSRGFMRFFDSFRYRRLGIGCRLQAGVCELSGVGQVEQGYYIVEGGGIPRINVIGYNRRVDWDILLQRLKRITGVQAAAIQ